MKPAIAPMKHSPRFVLVSQKQNWKALLPGTCVGALGYAGEMRQDFCGKRFRSLEPFRLPGLGRNLSPMKHTAQSREQS